MPARLLSILRRPWQRASTAQLAAASFLALIGIGTLGFRVLPGLYRGLPLGWIDALFMATSAVCVTGLSVVDVSRALTVAGQVWLLLLIQAGALGILTLAGLVVAVLGGRLSLGAEEGAVGPASTLPPRAGGVAMLRTVALFTLVLEAAGSLVLWLLWRWERGALEALWFAVFHSISAFCNAGFSLYSDSLVGRREEPLLLLCVSSLIVLGGIGFPVIQDLRGRLRGRHPRLTLHTRFVLVVTAFLLAGSALLYAVIEWDGALAPLSTPDRLVNAWFMSATARTAGFNTVDYDALSNPAVFLTLALMWIGGAPASVAGGVKVTTVAVLALVLWARLRGERHVSLASRTIPAETVQRAAGLIAGATLLLGSFLFLLLETEGAGRGAQSREHFIRLAFEIQSAFSTVGLSMGVTADLSPPGRLLLVPLMILGRIGPLVVLSAIVLQRRRHSSFRHAHEDVLVG